MSQTLSRKKRLTITAIVTGGLLLAGGTAAFAYWTATGTGTGSASTGTSTAFTIASTPVTTALLTPGGTSSEVVPFTVTNPGTGSQKLSSVVATIANGDASVTPWTVPATANANGCSAADYNVSAPTYTTGESAPIVIAGGGVVHGTVTITMNNLATSQDDCKGVTLPLFFAAK